MRNTTRKFFESRSVYDKCQNELMNIMHTMNRYVYDIGRLQHLKWVKLTHKTLAKTGGVCKATLQEMCRQLVSGD